MARVRLPLGFCRVCGAPTGSRRRKRCPQHPFHKYYALTTTRDDHGTEVRFHSLREAHRFDELVCQLQLGLITDLIQQQSFPLVVNGTRVGTYVADFTYTITLRGEHAGIGQEGPVVEDVKGVRTAVYRLKKKLVKAIHGIDVVEVCG